MTTRIDPKSVAKLRPGETIADTEVRGFRARRWASGSVTYDFRYRTKDGQRRSVPIGRHGDLTIEQARTLAKKRAWEVANEKDPAKERDTERATSSNTVSAIWDEFAERVLKSKRSAKDQIGAFNRLVRPTIGNRPIYDLKRGDVTRLFDKIADANGIVMADRMLSYLAVAFKWQQIRDEDFTSPIISGMRRASSKERARSRTLNDDELRAVWKATAQGTFGALVRFLLLTSARRSEASEMTWGELEGSTWALPATRDKVSVGIVRPLSKAAYAILKALPRNGAYVFAADGAPMTGFSSRKKQLDAESGVTGWTIHDLRRTARSLMSRAAVPSDHAELCLGHALPGIRATYDRHSYHAEKAAALQALAEQVMGIVG